MHFIWIYQQNIFEVQIYSPILKLFFYLAFSEISKWSESINGTKTAYVDW